MVYPRERQLSLFAAWEQRLSANTHVFADVLLNDYTKRLMFYTPMGEVTASDSGQRHLLRADPLASHVHDRTLSRVLTGGVRGAVQGVDYKLTVSHANHLGGAVRTGGAARGWESGIRLSAAELRQSSADYSAQTLAEFARWRDSDAELIRAQTQSYQAEGLLSGQWDGGNGLRRRWALGGGWLEDGIRSQALQAPGAPVTALKRRSHAVFGELEVDVSERLLAGVALRHDRYSDVGGASTGKLKAQWRFSSQGFVRMGWGTGFRAPSMRQMDPSANLSLSMGVDPLASGCDFDQGFEGRNRAVLCSGSEIYQVGNPELKPERSTHFNLGVRHEPTAQWSWGVDYWSLQVKDIFGSLNYNDILADPTLYARYATLPAPGVPERIQLVAQNLGRLDRKGIDYDLHFRQATDWGRLRVSLGGTH
jgi:outer membrane receptor protein involved in Fe transport